MHKITLRKGFPGERRQRSGITVTRTESVEAQLTKEQLDALRSDPELVVEEVKSTTSGKTKASKSATKRNAPRKTKGIRKMIDKVKSKKD